MNRVIKFRGWDGREMHRVCYVTDKGIGALGGGGMIIPREGSHDAIMQFTGLTDKNGVEIYEGDILRCHGFSGVVGFDKEEPRFSMTPFGDSESLALIVYEMQHFEVIGNIYQNQELLK